MIFKAVCKIKVPWMPQEEPLFITEIVAPTLDDASGFLCVNTEKRNMTVYLVEILVKCIFVNKVNTFEICFN